MSNLALRRRAMRLAYPGRDTGGWDPYAKDVKVDRMVAKLRRRKKNPRSWPAQHPWMTFFLGVFALSTVATVLR